MKRSYSSVLSITIIILLIINPVLLSINSVYAQIEIDTGYESELTMPDIGFDLETGRGIFDPIPATATLAGECLLNLITEKDLAFLGLDKISEILELLRLFNINLKLIIVLPVFVLKIWSIINFNMTKIFIIAAYLAGLDVREGIIGFLSDRASCFAAATSSPDPDPVVDEPIIDE